MPKNEFTLVGPEGAEVYIQDVGGDPDGRTLWEFDGSMTSDDLLAIAGWLRQNRPDGCTDTSSQGLMSAYRGYLEWSVMGEGDEG